jgi:predicted nucleic acid-binding protein
MSYWDTSALVKLYAMEADSAQFQGLTARGAPLVIARIARYEAHAAFRRREAEGSLPPGETAVLLPDILTDIAAGKIVVQADDAEVEKRFGEVMERCHSQTPPVFVRTNDALHIASALVAGEKEFVTADGRQHAAAVLMRLAVLP